MASWKNTVTVVNGDTVNGFTGPQFFYVPASYVDVGNATLLGG